MKSRISVRFLEPNDVVRFQYKGKGRPIIGIVLRTYQSGGKYGCRVVGTRWGSDDHLKAVDLDISEGQILELLWREEKEAR